MKDVINKPVHKELLFLILQGLTNNIGHNKELIVLVDLVVKVVQVDLVDLVVAAVKVDLEEEVDQVVLAVEAVRVDLVVKVVLMVIKDLRDLLDQDQMLEDGIIKQTHYHHLVELLELLELQV